MNTNLSQENKEIEEIKNWIEKHRLKNERIHDFVLVDDLLDFIDQKKKELI